MDITSSIAAKSLLSNIKQKSADAENLLTPLLQLKLNGAQVPLTIWSEQDDMVNATEYGVPF